MDIEDIVHFAIIKLTQYESANHQADMNGARDALLDTMRCVVAMTKITPAMPRRYKLPQRWENTDRLCMYLRCINALTNILSIRQGPTFRDYRNALADAWIECSRLCEYHGWNLPSLAGAPVATMTGSTALAVCYTVPGNPCPHNPPVEEPPCAHV